MGAYAGVDVRGGSPASRETELLKPINTAQKIHCVMLSGGSAYGLESDCGAMQYLEEKGIGVDTGNGLVPLACGASLFDLEVVQSKIRPDKAMGYEACVNAFCDKDFVNGNFGAGCGATIGKFHGDKDMMKSGIGSYAIQYGDLKLGAVVAVNALGDVYDIDSDKIIAGILNADHTGFGDSLKIMFDEAVQPNCLRPSGDANGSVCNTTIGCIVTNANVDKVMCNKLAQVAHNAYAKVIKPTHSTVDGDAIFAMASGKVEVAIDVLLALEVEVMAKAIRNAVLSAKPAYGLKAACDFMK